MDGLVHLLDLAGRTIAQLQARVADLENQVRAAQSAASAQPPGPEAS